VSLLLVNFSALVRSAKPTVWTMLSYEDVPLLAWYTPRDGFKMAGQGKSSTNRVRISVPRVLIKQLLDGRLDENSRRVYGNGFHC
jgi:hypothetical protein